MIRESQMCGSVVEWLLLVSRTCDQQVAAYNIYNHLDVDDSVIGIYMDLQKAFDSINHEILLHKLSNYGIRGTVLQWFKNYLDNRTQFVVVNGVPSNSLHCLLGMVSRRARS